MMFKRLVILFLAIFLVFPEHPLAFSLKKEKILIIYDRLNYYGYNSNIVSSVSQLLGAFDCSVKSLKIDEYRNGELQNYDKAIIVGIEGDFKNSDFISDLRYFNGTILWAGYGIENYESSGSLSIKGYARGNEYLYYTSSRGNNIQLKDMNKYLIQSGQSFPLIGKVPKEARVYGYIGDGTSLYPLVINHKNLWYISRMDDSTILFYIFSDLLRDIFKTNTMIKSNVFLRIEDVHPFRDPGKLKEIADYLHGEGVPFGIALIPAYVNPRTGYITKMSDMPQFVEAIKYMQERGGTVILHGYTHQEVEGDVTGEGYEFWDGNNDKPLDVDMEKYVYEKIYNGVTECLKNGIYPLAFESPHYAIDDRGYRELKKYFSTYSGQFQSNNRRFATSAFPWIIENTELFNRMIPENLGYVNPDYPFSIQKIESNYRNLTIVRGYTAGLFFHPFVDIKYLKALVGFFKERNLEFMDLKSQNNWVRISGIGISSSNEEISVSGFNAAPESIKKKSSISGINQVLIYIVGFFVIVFVIIFLLSKSINRRKFIR